MEERISKFFWDILATIFGLYLGYKAFVFLGEHIPTFGYIIGLMVGLFALGVGAFVVHGIEIIFERILGKLFGGIDKSLVKSQKLNKLQTELANLPLPQDAESLIRLSEQRERLLGEYIDFCLTDIGVSKIIEDYEITKEGLKEIYNKLLALGDGQWVGGHYVALSTLAYVQPLEYFLKAQKIGKSGVEVAYNLIIYFEKRMVLIPNEWLIVNKK